MLKSLSRVFGITGGGISLSVFLYFTVGSISASDYSFDVYAVRLFIGVLISVAGLIGSLVINKKPYTAAVLLIVSGILVFRFLISVLFECAPNWIAFPASSLLIAAGVLALISARRELQNANPNPSCDDCKEAYPVMSKLSRVLGIIFAALNLLPWVFLAAGYIYNCFIVGYGEPNDFSFALIAASGLVGSILLRKNPMTGAALMLASGGLTLYSATMMPEIGRPMLFFGIDTWWLAVTSLLLIAAGVLALIANNSSVGLPQNGTGPTVKDEEQPLPFLKKLSCTSGVTGIFLAALPFIMLAAADACFYFEDDELLLSIALLIVPVLTLTVTALAFSAIAVLRFFIRKRPLIAAIIMIVSSGLNLSAHFPRDYYLTPPAFIDTVRIVSALLLITAAVFTLIGSKKTSSGEGPRNKNPDISVKD